MPFGQFSHAGSHGFQQSVFDPKGSLTLQFTIPHGSLYPTVDHDFLSRIDLTARRIVLHGIAYLTAATAGAKSCSTPGDR